MSPEVTGQAASTIYRVVVSAQKPDPLIGHDTVAALIGAIVGGGIAAAVQWWAANRQIEAQKALRRQDVAEREKQQRESDLAVSFQLIVKVGRISTTVERIHDHVHDGRMLSLKRRIPLAGATYPTLSDEQAVSYSDAELSLIRKVSRDDLLNNLINLPYLQAQYIEGMALYRAKRAQLPELMSGNDLAPDGSATTTFEGVNAHRAQILQFELEDLLKYFLLNSFYDRSLARNTFIDLYAALADRYSIESLRFKFDLERLPDLPNPRDKPSTSKR